MHKKDQKKTGNILSWLNPLEIKGAMLLSFINIIFASLLIRFLNMSILVGMMVSSLLLVVPLISLLPSIIKRLSIVPKTEKYREILQRHEQLSQKAGKKIAVHVVDSKEPNAAATGLFRKVIVLNTGIFSSLSPAQIEGILAHEMSHIKHHDLEIMLSLSIFCSSVFLFLYPFSAVIAIIFITLSGYIQSFVQKWREYLADVGGANLTSKKQMADALSAVERLAVIHKTRNYYLSEKQLNKKIKKERERQETAFLGLSHPPIHRRIALLKKAEISKANGAEVGKGAIVSDYKKYLKNKNAVLFISSSLGGCLFWISVEFGVASLFIRGVLIALTTVLTAGTVREITRTTRRILYGKSAKLVKTTIHVRKKGDSVLSRTKMTTTKPIYKHDIIIRGSAAIVGGILFMAIAIRVLFLNTNIFVAGILFFITLFVGDILVNKIFSYKEKDIVGKVSN